MSPGNLGHFVNVLTMYINVMNDEQIYNFIAFQLEVWWLMNCDNFY